MSSKKPRLKLSVVQRAAWARINGKEPNKQDVKHALNFNPSIKNIKCFNGKRPDRPECGYHGSHNIPYKVAVACDNPQWIAAASILERMEGNFHKEIGTPGDDYYLDVIKCKLWAQKRLMEQGLHELADECRLATRSNIAWDILTTFPVERKHDYMFEAGKLRQGPFTGKNIARLTCATSGNRYTAVERKSIAAGNSHSNFVVYELSSHDKYGLTDNEIVICNDVLMRHIPYARYVAQNWMYGTINNPNVKWRFRLRRFEEGAESIFFGPNPNSLKPCRSVTQIFSDGRFIGMKPSPRGKQTNWGAGDYKVEIIKGIIHASCGTGHSQLPEMTGKLLWEVNIEGKDIHFN